MDFVTVNAVAHLPTSSKISKSTITRRFKTIMGKCYEFFSNGLRFSTPSRKSYMQSPHRITR